VDSDQREVKALNRVVIQTPARLHFGLIDMNGEIGRIDGGVGLALESPHTTIEAEQADGIHVECDCEPGIVDKLASTAKNLCARFDLPGARVRVLERPLPHLGLGSATQTLVGAGLAVSRLYGLNPTIAELGKLAGRGGTSGIGNEAIRSGGFILDGGHHFRRGNNSKHEYSPSGSTLGMDLPPVLARHDFPDWDVLVAVPLAEGASGLREVTLFKVVCPVPIDEVRRMCHIILMQMLPAVIERDLEAFGCAMQSFQKLGFKVFELRAQTKLPKDCMQFLTDNGGVGVGMSSWGPAVYAFGEDLKDLQEKTQAWLAANGGGETVLTKANNTGARAVIEE
jgi:beta-ribofuranosylaminobenzene 5'-phosphate synthase